MGGALCIFHQAISAGIGDLDTLPFPAFHLLPDMETCRFMPLELGRGCPFSCTFCSTNDFFRRRFRLKSPARFSPTFVLTDGGREIGRIEGYPGEDFFWGLLEAMMPKPDITEGTGAPSREARQP